MLVLVNIKSLIILGDSMLKHLNGSKSSCKLHLNIKFSSRFKRYLTHFIAQSQKKKKKLICSEKISNIFWRKVFLILWVMEFSSPKYKKLLKFQEGTFQTWKRKKNEKIKKIHSEKISYSFSKKFFYIFPENGTPMFWEIEISSFKIKKICSSMLNPKMGLIFPLCFFGKQHFLTRRWNPGFLWLLILS